MECQHCRAWNDAEERRCIRCGRRLMLAAVADALQAADANGRSDGRYFAAPLKGSALPAFEPLPGGRTEPAPPLPERHFQPSLFRDGAALDDSPLRPKVVPIPTLTPVRSTVRRNQQKAARPREARRVNDSQQRLDFQETLKEQIAVEAVIFCDAPVALPVHRLMAAFVDGALVAIAFSIFLAIFYFSGGEVVWNKTTALILVGAVCAVAQFYRLLWCLAGGDSPGMTFAGLRLVNFDGHVPDREQRAVRQAAHVLSFLSAGLGLIWALVDEENLTWHDHISKTFPTPG